MLVAREESVGRVFRYMVKRLVQMKFDTSVAEHSASEEMAKNSDRPFKNNPDYD